MALVIFDTFKGHKGDEIKSLLQESNILSVIVPSNCTVKILFDPLINPLWSSDHLILQGSKDKTVAMPSQFVFILWSTHKKNIDCLIPIWSQLQMLLWTTCDYPSQMESQSWHSTIQFPSKAKRSWRCYEEWRCYACQQSCILSQ